MKTKDKDLELIKKLRYQVHFGSYDWKTADNLMIKAVSAIRRLRRDIKKLKEQQNA